MAHSFWKQDYFNSHRPRSLSSLQSSVLGSPSIHTAEDTKQTGTPQMWVRGTAGRMHKGWMTKVLSTPGLWAALPSLMGIDLCRTTQETPPQLCWAWHCPSGPGKPVPKFFLNLHIIPEWLVKKSSFPSHVLPGTCREPFFLCWPTGRERITLLAKWSRLIPSHISTGAFHAGPRCY